ncbi:MAG: MFS transporter [Verrucomicrobiota bacterium]
MSSHAMVGGGLYGLGYLIAACALHIGNLPLLYLGFGVIGGIGLGLGYVTPVATSAQWFPDKKGFITGMVVMGFGFGALFMSKLIAPALMTLTGERLVPVFALTGCVLLVLAPLAGAFLRSAPAGYVPQGYTPPPGPAARATDAALTLGQCLKSARFRLMWMVFFCNITAGIMFIGFQSPVVYGTMLTAWSAGGIVGPQLAAYIKDAHGANAAHLTFAAGQFC